MNNGITPISYLHLAISFALILPVILIYYRWSLGGTHLLYAIFRMGSQLILIGFLLIPIFNNPSSMATVGILMIMIVAASVIALRPLKQMRWRYFKIALGSIATGGNIYADCGDFWGFAAGSLVRPALHHSVGRHDIWECHE